MRGYRFGRLSASMFSNCRKSETRDYGHVAFPARAPLTIGARPQGTVAVKHPPPEVRHCGTLGL